jgi:hypothetical protein
VQVSQEEWDAVVSAQTEVNPFLKWSFLNALEVSGSAVSTCAACEVCHSSCIAVEQLTGSMSAIQQAPPSSPGRQCRCGGCVALGVVPPCFQAAQLLFNGAAKQPSKHLAGSSSHNPHLHTEEPSS